MKKRKLYDTVTEQVTNKTVLLLLVPIILLSLVIAISIYTNENKRLKDIYSSSFREMTDHIQEQFELIDDFSDNFSQISVVKKLGYMRDFSEVTRLSTDVIVALNENLNAALSAYPALMDTAMLLDNIDTAFYNGNSISSIEDYLFFSNPDIDNRWKNEVLHEKIFSSYVNTIIYPVNIQRKGYKYENNGMYYVCPIKINPDNSIGVLLYRIDIEYLYEMTKADDNRTICLLSFDEQVIGDKYVDQKVLASNVEDGDTVQLSNGKYFVYRNSIGMTGISLTMLVPMQLLLPNGQLWILFVLYVAAISVLGYMLSKKVVNKELGPIDNIIGLIRGKPGNNDNVLEDNRYNDVFDRINGIIAERDRLSKEIASDNENLKLFYLHELLERPWESYDKIEKELNDCGVQFEYPRFMCVVYKGDNEQVIASIQSALRADGTQIYVVPYVKYIVLILNINDENYRGTIIQKLHGIYEERETEKKVFGVGCCYAELSGVEQSYNEALSITSEKVFFPDEYVFSFDKVKKRENSFYYPISTETKIISSLKLGRVDDTEKMILNIIEFNVKLMNISSDALSRLFVKLYYTGMRTERALDDLNVDQMSCGELLLSDEEEDTKRLAECSTIPEMVGILMEFYRKVAQQYTKLQTKDHPARKQIDRYLNKNMLIHQ